MERDGWLMHRSVSYTHLAALSIALYCQRCGKIEIHDISYFLSRNKVSMLKCSCSHIQATLVRDDSNRFRLRIPCGVCENVHEHLIKLKDIKKFTIRKIYCEKDYFELGYIGKRKYIEEILTCLLYTSGLFPH